MLNPEIVKLYHKARKHKPFMLVGHDAECSLRFAKTLHRFRELERLGVVRMRAEPEQESYLSVYGDDELRHAERNGHPIPYDQTRKELIALLDSKGVWFTVSEWRPDTDSAWEHADSCGMHTGYDNPLDPFENCYIAQAMQAAIEAYEDHANMTQREATEAHLAACADIATV